MRAMRMVWAVAACALLCAGLRGAESKTDEEGFIRDWLLLAPIAVPDNSSSMDEIDKQTLPDEGKLEPKEGDKVKVGAAELTWKKIKAPEYYYDVNENIPERQETGVSYAVVYVEAAEELKDIKAKYSSNDQGKLYINGKEIVKWTEGRSIDKDLDEAVVTLNKGVNVIVSKVNNDSNNWQGALRFVGADGKPITNLKIKLAK